MGKAIIRVPLDVLRDALLFPEEYRFVGAWSNFEGRQNVVGILVEHDSIPEVKPEEPYPYMNATYKTERIIYNRFIGLKVK